MDNGRKNSLPDPRFCYARFPACQSMKFWQPLISSYSVLPLPVTFEPSLAIYYLLSCPTRWRPLHTAFFFSILPVINWYRYFVFSCNTPSVWNGFSIKKEEATKNHLPLLENDKFSEFIISFYLKHYDKVDRGRISTGYL